jgi:hypothetical protein
MGVGGVRGEGWMVRVCSGGEGVRGGGGEGGVVMGG